MSEDGEQDEPRVVARDCVVGFHYELFDADGTPLESSRDTEPMVILHGHGNVVPGVEEGLTGRAVGERFEIDVPPELGYGPRRADFSRRISKKHLVHAPKRLRPGIQVHVRTEQGVRTVTVLKVGASVIDVDINHPLAGQTLRFAVEIVSLRAAHPEEIAHGHAHGPGGHAH